MASEKVIHIPIRKIILLAVIGVIILMFSDIPYFNLLANTQLLFFAIWVLAVFSLNLNSRTMVLTFFVLLFYCLILLLLNEEKEAQAWGDWSFPVLVITLTKFYWENRKEMT